MLMIKVIYFDIAKIIGHYGIIMYNGFLKDFRRFS